MLPEDLMFELAEDREWDRLRDTVDRLREDLESEKQNHEEDEPV